MRSKLELVLTVVLIGAATACALQPGNADLVVLEVPDDPTITFKVWVQAGSQNDPPGKEGLAYITAQMIADAASTRNSLEQILEKLYPMAASYSIRVDREMTVLTGRTHTDNVDGYYELFTDAYLRPAFRQEDFDRLKSDTSNYLRNTLRYQEDEELGKAALYGMVYESTPYAHPSQGTVSGVESLTLEDVKQFYASHYREGNVQLGLGGGFSRAMRGQFASTLEELPEGGIVEAPSIAPAEITTNELLLVSKPDANASISLGFPIEASRGDRDFYALWIANSWLGEHRNSSSHLYQVIREARGMNYGDYSYIEAFPEGGRRSVPPTHVGRHHQMFEIWIRTLPNEQAHFALRAAVRELRMLIENGMSEEDFELTRGFLEKYVLHFADTTRGRLGYAVDDQFYGIDGEGHLARFRKMMQELTLEDVNEAVRRHLRAERLKIAIVTGDADGLKDALVADLPSPMAYASEKPAEILTEDEEIARFPLSVEAADVRIVSVDEIFER